MYTFLIFLFDVVINECQWTENEVLDREAIKFIDWLIDWMNEYIWMKFRNQQAHEI